MVQKHNRNLKYSFNFLRQIHINNVSLKNLTFRKSIIDISEILLQVFSYSETKRFF